MSQLSMAGTESRRPPSERSPLQRGSRRAFLRSAIGHVTAASAASGIVVPAAGQARATPSRIKDLLQHQQVPHNAEPRLHDLVRSWLTPESYFYVRSHGAVPRIDPERYRLRVEGLVDTPLELSIDDLNRDFEHVTVTATLTCAGNRRGEFNQIREVGGVQWQAGAVGNAQWRGVRLADVLDRAGIRDAALHVGFDGLDEHEKKGRRITFGGSIPVAKARNVDTSLPGPLLALEMNGRPLPPDHGFPLRVVVPGYIGARSVKWLAKIIATDRPSENYYVQRAYRLVPEDTDGAWSAATPLYEYRLNSVIARTARDSKRNLIVEGYALPPGAPDRIVTRVEVSPDGGQSWRLASLTSPSRPFCWSLWRVRFPVAAIGDAAVGRLLVRAIDSAGDVQPERLNWNLKGYMNNAWHSATPEA